MELTFIYSKSLTLKAVNLFWNRMYIRKREIILSSMLLVGLVLLAVYSPGQRVRILVLAVWLFSFWLWRLRDYYVIRREKLSAFSRLDGKGVKVEITDAGLRFNSLMGDSEMPWSSVQAIWQYPDLWLLVWNRRQFSFLPTEQMGEGMSRTLSEKSAALQKTEPSQL